MKQRTTIRRAGRKTREWASCRATLKREFEAAGVTRCESCGSTFILSFAHRFKRADITTPEELRTVALLDQRCHSRCESMSHEAMFNAITAIIVKAGRQVAYAMWKERPR